MSSTNNEQALVLYTKPSQPTHIRSVFGRLIATLGGVLFFPFGIWAKSPEHAFFNETLPEGPMSPAEEEWYMNQNARRFLQYAKTFTPQVLFRGFTPDSGGGDNRLNGKHGVIPHGFLDGTVPTSMWHILHLFDMISGHLEGDENIVSDFSSWSQIWRTALRFSQYPHNNEARIAVLDTGSIEEHVWSSCDLLRAELAQDEYTDEYLVYGPITGPKYHCVSPFELYSKSRIRDLLGNAPFVFGEDPGTSAIELGAVLSAVDVAAFLQPRSGRSETLAVLTARFVSYRAAWITQEDKRRFISYSDVCKYLQYVATQVQDLAMQTQDGDIVLVDSTMYTCDRYLRFEVQLLQAVQIVARRMAHEVRAAIWETCRLQHKNEPLARLVFSFIRACELTYGSSFTDAERLAAWRTAFNST